MTTSTGVLRADIAPTMAKLNHVVKAALVASFAVAIIVPPEAVAGKAMDFRAPLFLAPAVRRVGGAGGLALTYSDTVGDLLLSSTGGLVGSVLGVLYLGPSAGRVSGGV
ncbi:MAG: hypothetical protein OES24_03720 [Acidimicrobiia bacterium]|nr:hypothetical protein [Acidimicrobiia bacterium]